jgi:hypothetical protein
MFRAFALVLSFFVGMLGCTAPASPYDRDDSVARATAPGDCAVNTAPRDQLEQGSGRVGVGEQRASVGDDDDVLVVTTPIDGGADEREASGCLHIRSMCPSSERATAAARGPPVSHA